MDRRKVLVVDGLRSQSSVADGTLESRYDLRWVATEEDALGALDHGRFDVFIVDMAAGAMTVEALVKRVCELDHAPVVIAVADSESTPGHGRLPKQGFYDYIHKPTTADRVLQVVGRAAEFGVLRRENRRLKRRLCEQDKLRSLIGHTEVIDGIREKVRLVAFNRVPVLISGENGVGKEVVAREIHRVGDRRDKPLVRISCAAIPEALLDADFFGQEKDSFVGPGRTIPGKIELAHRGTLLIDEIGEMPMTVQAKLLRVIQEGEFERLGATRPIRVDVRIIATTKRVLQKEVRVGNFREDLFYRLNVVPLEMPPLRDRRQDVPLLVNHFIETLSRENNKPVIRLTDNAMQKLCNAFWRGNVRELENIVERAVILASGATLDENYFQFDDEHDDRLSQIEHAFRYCSIRQMEKLMIMHRLQCNEQNRTRTAQTLDISVRTLRNKLRDYRQKTAPRGDDVLLVAPKS
ncbi:MAG: sigma-54 dependent transcriptional regulator [Candidatus Krumholzibacteria bacterium]|nr:sigma-54 dependent transcriptional regulator [Candidatus Krumholzibacteria bacterium]